MITVIQPGPLATVQDLGRPGYGTWGIVPGGAADRGSIRLANRLVGNAESAAAVEITGGGFHARFSRTATIALTGAPSPMTVAARAAAPYGPVPVPAGAEVVVGRSAVGVRSYLAVRGGIDIPQVLGSRATDLIAGLGLEALRAGDELPVGTQTTHYPSVDLAPVPSPPNPVVITVITGPRADWFTPDALHILARDPYTVTPASDRVGVRFTGPPLHRRTARELPSEPAIRGAVEIPPDGQPIMFLVDHPTTCGYPVIAVADAAGADLAAQLRPGQQVIFRPTPPEPCDLHSGGSDRQPSSTKGQT